MSFQELIELVGKAVDAGGVGIVVVGVVVATALALRLVLRRGEARTSRTGGSLVVPSCWGSSSWSRPTSSGRSP